MSEKQAGAWVAVLIVCPLFLGGAAILLMRLLAGMAGVVWEGFLPTLALIIGIVIAVIAVVSVLMAMMEGT